MDRQIKQVEFTKLRHAYQTVKAFLVEASFVDVENLKTRVAEDLGMYGDDNYELLVKFVDKFELDHKGFDYSKHFHSEGELFGSGAALINLLALSIWLPLKTIELLTFNKVKLPKPSFYQPNSDVSDMTFKDLLTWYIEGKYATEKDIKYEIKTSHNKV
ncbi:DUF1493 family protein [Rufibacter psychrotolerans]|uniref:DUF1493 family protein n=1 Tax=Rufibacter psychrotolerans TaxID=2812556 RepID=UPI001968A495|nr:DUF1493 family protein [Rufibacter sp. SYSU D00308]